MVLCVYACRMPDSRWCARLMLNCVFIECSKIRSKILDDKNIIAVLGWSVRTLAQYIIWWCLFSIFLICCWNEWGKKLNAIFCLQVFLWKNFTIMFLCIFFFCKSWEIPSPQTVWCLGIPFFLNMRYWCFSSFYWGHLNYKDWICERLLNLQKTYILAKLFASKSMEI